MPGEAKLIDSTSKPSSAFSAMVIATTAICSRLIGSLAMMSLGSVGITEEYTHPGPGTGFVIRNGLPLPVDEGRGDGLPHMACRVLGAMKQETEHGGRQTGPAYLPLVEERGPRCRAQLLERRVDDAADVGDERGHRRRRISRLPLGPQRGALRIRQRVSSRICKEPIERAAGVADMKANRRRAAGPTPDMFGGHGRDRRSRSSRA